MQMKVRKCINKKVRLKLTGWMHKTSAQGWCTGKTQRDGMGRGGRRGDRDGEHM